MNQRPDVSVIVPCYNAQQFLPQCLESLKSQAAPLIEMIFIDDGSTDETPALLDAFAQDESRAKVLHVKNGGVSAARNRGIELALGRYIAFADADDAYEPGALSALYDLAKSSDAQIVSADHTVLCTDTQQREEITARVGKSSGEIVREIIHLHRIYNNIWNKLYDRALFDKGIRLNPHVRIGEDALLNLQLYSRAARTTHLPKSTYVYRVHGGSAMASIREYSQAHAPMLCGMNEILLEMGTKERYFTDFLQSCVWIDEKQTGILACMRRFNREIRPLTLDGVEKGKLKKEDRALFDCVRLGAFPAFYILMRGREKLTKKRWGIRR